MRQRAPWPNYSWDGTDQEHLDRYTYMSFLIIIHMTFVGCALMCIVQVWIWLVPSVALVRIPTIPGSDTRVGLEATYAVPRLGEATPLALWRWRRVPRPGGTTPWCCFDDAMQFQLPFYTVPRPWCAGAVPLARVTNPLQISSQSTIWYWPSSLTAIWPRYNSAVFALCPSCFSQTTPS